MIPKVIHYCWFGKKKKSKLIKDCIQSWKKCLPDYKIIEWNESNCELTNPFVKEAYRLKKWAFVSDFIRLKVLYENGGIYFDTDMMVIKTFDNLLNCECFFGAEDVNFISCGVIASVEKHTFIKRCLKNYESINIQKEINWKEISIPKLITDVFRKKNSFLGLFEKEIVKNGVIIYPTKYFYPLSYEDKDDFKNYKKYIAVDSYAIHLWNSSWIEYNEFHYLRTGKYLKGLQSIIKNFNAKKINFKYFKKIASSIKLSMIKKK